MSDEITVNKEAWHEAWLRCYERISLDFLAKMYGKGDVRGIIVRFNVEESFKQEEAIYDVHSEIALPRGCGRMCALMAPHALAREIIVPPGRINGSTMTSFPKYTFFLQPLLECGYPFKPDGRGFKPHAELMIGYEDLDGVLAEMGTWAAMLTAFFGFGYVLTSKVREKIDPLGSAAQIIEKSSETYLCVMDHGKRKKNGQA